MISAPNLAVWDGTPFDLAWAIDVDRGCSIPPMLKTTLLSTTLASVLLAAAPTAAQTAGAPVAPKDRSVDITNADLNRAARELLERTLITQRMLEGGSLTWSTGG